MLRTFRQKHIDKGNVKTTTSIDRAVSSHPHKPIPSSYVSAKNNFNGYLLFWRSIR